MCDYGLLWLRRTTDRTSQITCINERIHHFKTTGLHESNYSTNGDRRRKLANYFGFCDGRVSLGCSLGTDLRTTVYLA